QMQALAERLTDAIGDRVFVAYQPLAFHALKTVVPAPEASFGSHVAKVGRRAKYLAFELDGGVRLLIHLSQAGRLDIEEPPKRTKPKGAAIRLEFAPEPDGAPDLALLLREHGTERKAGWWLLGPGDDGPLAKLGPEPDSLEFETFVMTAEDGRRIHTILRDQRTVAGIGRGYADDILHRARISPFASLKSLDADTRRALVDAIRAVLADGLARERTRTGGLSENKLGEHFTVHGKYGLPCPECRTDLHRVSYESHEVVYCPQCQTGGKVLADRRMSRLLK
ncbi:MAG TPA: DNA-formamidopyrimidine glycosylase family protein, partial [Acidimicrobiia bacterium]